MGEIEATNSFGLKTPTLGMITSSQVSFANNTSISLCIASFHFGKFITFFQFLGSNKRPLGEIEATNNFGLKTTTFDLIFILCLLVSLEGASMGSRACKDSFTANEGVIDDRATTRSSVNTRSSFPSATIMLSIVSGI